MKKVLLFSFLFFSFQIIKAQTWNSNVLFGFTCVNTDETLVSSIAKDSIGNLWVATDTGLFKRVNGLWSFVSDAPIDSTIEFIGQNHTDIAIDNQNRIWWLGRKNLYHFNGVSWILYNNFPDFHFFSVETDAIGNVYAVAFDTLNNDDNIVNLQTNSTVIIPFFAAEHIFKVNGDSIFISNSVLGIGVFHISTGISIPMYSNFYSNFSNEDYGVTPNNTLFEISDQDINSNFGAMLFLNAHSQDSGLFSIPISDLCQNVFFNNLRCRYYNGNIYYLTYNDTNNMFYQISYYNLQNQSVSIIPISVMLPYELGCASFEIIDGEIIVSGNAYPGTPMFFVTYDLNSGCSANFTMSHDTSIAHNWFALNQCTGSTPINYLWSWGDGTTSTGATPSHIYSNPGFYPICVTINDGAGCTSTYCDSSTYIFKVEEDMSIATVNVVTQLPNGTPTVTPQSEISLSPNPTTNEIKLSNLPQGESQIKIFNLLGQQVKSKSVTEQNSGVNISDLPSGIYEIAISNNENFFCKKFVKE